MALEEITNISNKDIGGGTPCSCAKPTSTQIAEWHEKKRDSVVQCLSPVEHSFYWFKGSSRMEQHVFFPLKFL